MNREVYRNKAVSYQLLKARWRRGGAGSKRKQVDRKRARVNTLLLHLNFLGYLLEDFVPPPNSR